MEHQNLQRIERKVDDLTDAINRLVLFEERQLVQAEAITKLSARTTATEQKLAMWINRGVGVWAAAALCLTLYKNLPIQ